MYKRQPVREEPIIDLTSDAYFMGQALREAHKAYAAEEVPIGAVVVCEGKVIARGWNQVETLSDATAHAEMLALTAAQNMIGDWRLENCTLYVTKEPCPMCAGAIIHCRPERVVFGCPDLKGGAAGGWVSTRSSSDEPEPGWKAERGKPSAHRRRLLVWEAASEHEPEAEGSSSQSA